MGIYNKMVAARALEKCTIRITLSNGELTVQPPQPEVAPGDVVEWLAEFEFVVDFAGHNDSPVSYGQYEFVSAPAGALHRVALVAKKTYRRKLVYDIRTAAGVLDPALIIDPNRLKLRAPLA